MSNDDGFEIDMSFLALIVGLIVLYSGSPDLMDAILYWLTDGKIPLPKS